MSAIDISDVMDGLASSCASLMTSTYAWPVDAISVPCALVDFPSSVELGVTFGRGGDHAVFPVWLVVGRTAGKDGRDALSALIAGGSDIYAAIEGAHAWGDADVTSADVGKLTVGAIEYLGLRLTVDVRT